MKGHISPRLRVARDDGAVPGGVLIGPVTLVLNRSAAQQTDLDALLAAQQQPGSPLYRHWLTPEEFGGRFGVSDSDLAKVTAWLRSRGLTVEEVARSRSWVRFSGTAARLSSALGTQIHYFEVSGERHYANISEPRLPLAIQQVALALEGLTSFRPKPAWQSVSAPPAAADCDPSAQSGPLTPENFKTIYDVPASETGMNQTIAVVGEVDPSSTSLLQDVQTFRSYFGLPATTVETAPTPANETLSTQLKDLQESDLDLEWSGAIAPQAELVYVPAKTAFEAAREVIDNRLASVMSMSYGTCEPEASGFEFSDYEALAQQGNAEGITWVAASGDSGPAACDVHDVNPEATNGLAVWLPASLPEVTGVGGTEFADYLLAGSSAPGGACYWNSAGLALGYIPEQAWNDTAVYDTLLASGGGVSQVYATPVWQSGISLATKRAVPDVSFAASGLHDPYQIVTNGGTTPGPGGGTSAAAPSFAGVVALLGAATSGASAPAGNGLGNVNPMLYALAVAQPGVFHDVTVGNTYVPCSGGTGCNPPKPFGYAAGPGYDMATGLGSLDVKALLSAHSLTPTTTTLTTDSSSYTVGGTMTLMATVTPGVATATPTGTVYFFAQAAAGQNNFPLPVALGSASFPSKTGTTLQLPVSSRLLPIGTSALEAVYSGDPDFAGSQGTASVNVTPSMTSSSVVVSVTDPVAEMSAIGGSYNWTALIALTNLSSVPTTLNQFSVSGLNAGTTPLNLSGFIAQLFSSTTITGNGTITGTYSTSNITPPAQVEFNFGGMDTAVAGGAATAGAWNASQTVWFGGPAQAITSLTNAAFNGTDEVPVTDPNAPPDAPLIRQSVFAPGMAMTVKSSNGGLASFTSTAGLPLPTALPSRDGSSYVSATINGTAAPLYYVSGKQINLQIPYELQTSFSATDTSFPVVMLLTSGGVTWSYSFTLQPVAPGIFADNGVWNATDSQEPVQANSKDNPAPAGSVVIVYYTGAGALAGTLGDGQPAVPSTPAPQSRLNLTLSGKGITPIIFSDASPATSAGVSMAPGMVGIAQAAFRLPNNLPTGGYQLSIALQGMVGSGTTAALLPNLVTGNSVSLWVGACTENCVQ